MFALNMSQVFQQMKANIWRIVWNGHYSKIPFYYARILEILPVSENIPSIKS